MSEHDDDRDLDAFLNRQSPISKAWREAAQQDRAPEALDAAILAAAAGVRPAATPKPVPRLRRWRVPIGLAASLLVGIGVLREAQRDPGADAVLRGEPPAQWAAAPAEAQPAPSSAPMPEQTPRAADFALPPPPVPATPLSPLPPAAVASPFPPPAIVAKREAADEAEAAAEAMLKQRRAEATSKLMPMPERALAAAAAEAAAARPSSPPPAAAPPGDVWQPAHYRGLLLGQTTLDEVLRQHGAPEVDTDTRAARALLPDGRLAHRLLDYGRRLDPRGRVRLYFDAGSTALAWANLVLDPPLPLAAVQTAEGLAGDGIARAADAPPCDAQPTPPGEPAWPQLRSWPGRGVQLLLAGPDRVVEISYLERCQ